MSATTGLPRPVPPRHLPRSVRRPLLLLHVVASVGLLGQGWVLVVLNLTALNTDDGELARAAYELMSVLVFAGGIPLSMASLVTGLILALGTHWGLLRHAWVFAKLLLLTGVILVGSFLFTPELLAEAGPPYPDALQRTQVAVVSAQVLMLLTATALSVYKPGLPLFGRPRIRRAAPGR